MLDDLDRDSLTPLYEQLADILRRGILDGTWASRLPSEPDLVQAYGISRDTAHKAMDILAAEGLVQRSKGRGTFVTPRPDSKKSRQSGD